MAVGGQKKTLEDFAKKKLTKLTHVSRGIA